MAAGWTTLNIMDAGGTARIMRVWGEDTVTGPFSFGQVLADSSGSAALAKAEDAASANGDYGIAAMAIQKATPADSAGSDGDYSPLQMSAGRLWVAPSPVTSGGLLISSTILGSGTNATNVKASAGQIYKIECFNNSANIAYLKIYNTAGTPTAGSGTPVLRILIPASASGAGVVSSYEVGTALGTGIGYTVTGGIADADTAAVAASAFIVNIHYK